MIFVVLGTHELPFQRLLKTMEEEIIAGNIHSNVIVQSGHTHFASDNMEFIPFMTYREMEQFYADAEFIVTHGGTGSITTAVKLGKKVIAVPRLHKYGEHNDDHQIEIVRQFTESGHILSWNEEKPFHELLSQLHSFEPVPFVSGRKKIVSLIENFVENEVK